VSAARPPVPAPGAAAPAERFAPGSLLRAGLLVAPLLALGNGINYAYNLVMARLLGPAGYGALGALLALALIASVPGLALQVVVARHTALRGRDQHALAELWTATLAGVVGAGLALGLLIAAASPLLTAYLNLGSAAPAWWLAVSVAPLPALAAVQGMLQGRERFAALAWVLLAAAAGKLAAGVGLVALGAGVEGAIAAVALGSLAAVALGLAWVRPGLAAGPLPRGRSRWWWPLPRPRGHGRSWLRPLPRGLGREAAGATTAILGLFVLANVDVLLARHHLDADASGLYAAGALVAKVAYWAPQVVVLLVFPRLVTSGARRRLLARSAGCVAGFGALLVVAAAAAPHLAASVSFGRSYLAVGPVLPLFAALGTCLALVQLVLFSGIASADARLTWLLAAAVGVEVAVVTTAMHDSVTEIVTVSLTVTAVVLLAGWLLERGRDAPAGRVEGAAP
jgi:O-antigen/teichoic acid export membrane protein